MSTAIPNESLTLETMTARLDTTIPERLREQERVLEEAEERFHRLTYRLQFKTEEEHQAHLKEHRGELEKIRGQVDEATVSLEDQLRTIETYLSTPLPLSLSEQELSQATVRANLIQEEVAKLPLDKLAQRIQGAIITDDRAAQYLYVRYYSELAIREPKKGEDTASVSRLISEIQTRLADKRMDPLKEKYKTIRLRTYQLQGRAREPINLDEVRRSSTRYSTF